MSMIALLLSDESIPSRYRCFLRENGYDLLYIKFFNSIDFFKINFIYIIQPFSVCQAV